MLSPNFHPSRPTIGLVLGAGGTRGTAHAAVIQVLQWAGIPIDLVVGASVGAMYGLALAGGMPADELARTARETTPLDLARFYAGRLRPSLFNPIGRLLLETGAGKNFADLDMPFAVMATDLARGVTDMLTSGPVLPAVQASISLPFIARPVEISGRHYVDGGLLETLPVRAARAMGADLVIGVCLGYNYIAPAMFRKRPSSRTTLERLGQSARRSRVPAVEQIRSFARLSAATFDPPPPSREADLTIWPEFGRIGPNSMVGAAFCFDQGLAAAREALPLIERLLLEDVHNTEQ
jgi:NTE family protein